MMEQKPINTYQQVESVATMTPVESHVEPTPIEVAPTPVTEAPQPVIYGGASPIVSGLDLGQSTPHQIYGGANPLENTQSMPIMSTPMSTQVVQPVQTSQMTSPVQTAEPVIEPVVDIVQ